MIELRGHHVASLAYYLCYGPMTGNEYLDHANEKFVRLLSDSSTEVKIVAGLDFVCESGGTSCPKKTNTCSYTHDDDFCIEEYGLTVGKVYTVGELVEIAKENGDVRC